MCFVYLGEERQTVTPDFGNSRETPTGQRVDFGKSKKSSSLIRLTQQTTIIRNEGLLECDDEESLNPQLRYIYSIF